MDCSPPGSSVHGILQARILEWVAIPFSRGSSWPGIVPSSLSLQADSFTIWATREALILFLNSLKKNLKFLESKKEPLATQLNSNSMRRGPLYRKDAWFRSLEERRLLLHFKRSQTEVLCRENAESMTQSQKKRGKNWVLRKAVESSENSRNLRVLSDSYPCRYLSSVLRLCPLPHSPTPSVPLTKADLGRDKIYFWLLNFKSLDWGTTEKIWNSRW